MAIEPLFYQRCDAARATSVTLDPTVQKLEVRRWQMADARREKKRFDLVGFNRIYLDFYEFIGFFDDFLHRPE